MEAMWKNIGKLLTLEPKTDLFNSVYLGCNQTEEQADPKYVHEKNDLFRRITSSKVESEKDQAQGNLKHEAFGNKLQ